jgi:adenosylcobinamide-phosphate synthase
MALLATIYLLLHFIIGLVLPYRPGFKPYFYQAMHEAGADLEKRLNRDNRPQSVRIVRGTLAGLMLGALGAIAGAIMVLLGHTLLGFFLQLPFLAACINFMTQVKVVKELLKHLAANNLPQTAATLQPYVQEPLKDADGHTVIRKAIEYMAVSFNQFLLAPVFWLLMAGPIGLALYMTFSALQRAFGPPDKRRKYFSQFVRGIDILLNLVPAALGAAFLTGTGLFIRRQNPWRALGTVYQQSRACGYYYQGWLISALAGGLGVTLGGPVRYTADYAESHPWVGLEGATARVQPNDLFRAAQLQYAFFVCAFAMVFVLMIFGK